MVNSAHVPNWPRMMFIGENMAIKVKRDLTIHREQLICDKNNKKKKKL